MSIKHLDLNGFELSSGEKPISVNIISNNEVELTFKSIGKCIMQFTK